MIYKMSFISLIMGLLIYPSLVFAGGGGFAGGARESTQILNKLELIPNTISANATRYATYQDMIKNTVTDPITGGLISIAIESTSNAILAWINGGLNGTPLIQTPEDYIERQALNEVRIFLGNIPQGDPFADVVFENLVNEFKTREDGEVVKNIISSNIPSIVQSTMCEENMLTRLAIERVQNTKGEYDMAIMQKEKKFLYDYACVGDPREDQMLSLRLMDLYKQRPELGGDDALLAMVSGDTGFMRMEKARFALYERKEGSEELAKKQLFDGLNAVSETKCIEQKEDAAGNVYCAREVVVNPGDAVQTTLETVSNSGLLRLISTDADGFTSSLSSYMNQVLSKGLNFSASSISGTTNTSQTIFERIPLTNDLVGNSAKKADIIKVLEKQLTFDSENIAALEKVNANSSRAITEYQNKIAEVKRCYDSLLSRNVASSEDARVISALSYYNDRISQSNNFVRLVDQDAAKIRNAKNLITETRNKLNSSNSSQEMNNILSAYRSLYENEGYPTSALLSERSQTYEKYKGESENDQERDGHLQTCRQIEDSVWVGNYNAY